MCCAVCGVMLCGQADLQKSVNGQSDMCCRYVMVACLYVSCMWSLQGVFCRVLCIIRKIKKMYENGCQNRLETLHKREKHVCMFVLKYLNCIINFLNNRFQRFEPCLLSTRIVKFYHGKVHNILNTSRIYKSDGISGYECNQYVYG